MQKYDPAKMVLISRREHHEQIKTWELYYVFANLPWRNLVLMRPTGTKNPPPWFQKGNRWRFQKGENQWLRKKRKKSWSQEIEWPRHYRLRKFTLGWNGERFAERKQFYDLQERNYSLFEWVKHQLEYLSEEDWQERDRELALVNQNIDK